MRGIGQTLRIFRQRLDLLGQFLAGKAFLPDHPRPARLGKFARIGGLMIVRRDGQRNENRGAANGGQFGNGRGTRAPDEQMRIGQPRRHVLEIGGEFRRDAVRTVAFAHGVEVFGAALLRDLQALAQSGREHGQAIGHDFGKHSCTLAAAGHQHAQQAILAEWRERLFTQRQDPCTNGVADEVDLFRVLGIEPLDFGVSRGDGLHAACEKAVHAAQHGVLLMHHGRYSRAGRGEDRGQRGITAETDHRARLETLEQAQRHAAPFHHRFYTAEPAQRVLAEAPGRNDMRGHEIGLAGNVRPARIGDQCDMMATPFEFGRQREGREQMPAGATGGKDVMAAGTGHG